MGLFDFLKKEETKKEIQLPFVVRTENVNESLMNVSKTNKIALSSLDFEILDFKTYIKIGNSGDFVEVDDKNKHFLQMRDFLINENNHIKQVYEIEIKKAKFDKNFELIGKMDVNKFLTRAKFIISPESTLVYKRNLEKRLKEELNKKKLRNSFLIELFDEKMNYDIEKVVAKLRVLGKLENEEEIELCHGIDPVENVEGKVLYHYLTKKENLENHLIFPVKKGDLLIEVIKAIQGKNGRDCRGKIIKIPKVRKFEIPDIHINPNEIKKEEDERKIKYIALKDGYIYKEGDSYSIKDKMEIRQINLKTGNVSGAKDSNIKLEVKESDALKEAIADNMVVETTVLIVRGNVGNSAKINAKELKIQGQTHQKAKIYADKAYINVHKGYAEGKEIEVNRLENGIVKGRKVKIKQAIGGKIIAHQVEVELMGSHLEIYALNEIVIKKLKGSENKLIISPAKVLDIGDDVDKIEKKIQEVERNIEIKISEYNKRKQILLKNKPTIERMVAQYKENKKKGIKTSPTTLKKIKEYNDFKDKTLELKNEIVMLKQELQELNETLQNFQTAIFNAKIVSYSPWTAYNRIEFDILEPPVKLTYDTKGDEGVCGFKIKDYGNEYKIVKIKVKKDDSGAKG